MRRHPVIGLAVPGRKLQDRQIGCEEFQRPRQLLHARAIAADHGQADRGLLRVPLRSRARDRRRRALPRSSATLASVSARPGARPVARAILPAASCAETHRAKRLDAVEQRAGIFRWQRPAAAQRGIKIGIGQFDQALELTQLAIPKVRELRHPQSGRGSGPSHACRGASSEIIAACGGHRARGSIGSIQSSLFQFNAKSPDGPGAVDIASGSVDVSTRVR